jgi:hypothetical protein
MTFVDPKPGVLIACDGCGAVAMQQLAPDWKPWHPVGTRLIKHHCGVCVDGNELIRGGLVYGRAPEEAINYGIEVADHG